MKKYDKSAVHNYKSCKPVCQYHCLQSSVWSETCFNNWHLLAASVVFQQLPLFVFLKEWEKGFTLNPIDYWKLLWWYWLFCCFLLTSFTRLIKGIFKGIMYLTLLMKYDTCRHYLKQHTDIWIKSDHKLTVKILI